MSFSNTLNRYIDELGCSAKALADASGVSPAVISRYRSGDRIPAADCPQLQRLAAGISLLSDDVYKTAEVRVTLTQAVTGIAVEYDDFLANLNRMLSLLSIRSCEIARALNYDASYISRILAGLRRPSDIPQFIDCLSGLVARRCTEYANARLVGSLLGIHPSELVNEDTCSALVAAWLSGIPAMRRLSPRPRPQPLVALRTA